MSTGPRFLRVRARDGYPLAVSLFEPAGGSGPQVVLAPAMGVGRRFYDRYAAYLASRGFSVASFDYRGIGGSRPPERAGFDARLLDWGRHDLAAVVEWAAGREPGAGPLVVGHSLGAQLVGVDPAAARVTAMIAVAAGTGYWRAWGVPERYALAFLWHAAMPALTRAFGYFPARLLRIGEQDLPPGVALDWARWCRHPDYAVDASGEAVREGFRAFSGRIRAYSFADDFYAPRRGVDRLLGLFEAADVEHRHVRPGDVGLEDIGHFGFFRKSSREPLWRESARWLREAAG